MDDKSINACVDLFRDMPDLRQKGKRIAIHRQMCRAMMSDVYLEKRMLARFE